MAIGSDFFLKQGNVVFSITDENKCFSITTPGYLTFRGGVETIIKLRELLELRSQNHIELHVEEVRKRGNHEKKETSNINYLILILTKMRYLRS